MAECSSRPTCALHFHLPVDESHERLPWTVRRRPEPSVRVSPICRKKLTSDRLSLQHVLGSWDQSALSADHSTLGLLLRAHVVRRVAPADKLSALESVCFPAKSSKRCSKAPPEPPRCTGSPVQEASDLHVPLGQVTRPNAIENGGVDHEFCIPRTSGAEQLGRPVCGNDGQRARRRSLYSHCSPLVS